MLFNSPELTHEGEIPSKFTRDGENLSIPFNITYISGDTKSLAFIVEDTDDTDNSKVLWMVWNISSDITELKTGDKNLGVVGKNSNFENEWESIAPLDTNEHRYNFKLFALDSFLELDPLTATKEDFYEELGKHQIGNAEFIGKYTKVEVKI